MKRLLILACLITCSSVSTAAQFYPVDEADKATGFTAFRQSLMQAIARKDVAFVISVLHPDILNSFGGNGGIEEFKQQWQPAAPDTRLWEELQGALLLGGCYEVYDNGDRVFWAPYTWCDKRITKGVVDDAVWQLAMVVGEGVSLRREPKILRNIIRRLSYERVSVNDWQGIVDDQGRGWLQVVTDNNETGYVAAAYVRGIIGYRAGFVLQDGKWQMRVFVAGD